MLTLVRTSNIRPILQHFQYRGTAQITQNFFQVSTSPTLLNIGASIDELRLCPSPPPPVTGTDIPRYSLSAISNTVYCAMAITNYSLSSDGDAFGKKHNRRLLKMANSDVQGRRNLNQHGQEEHCHALENVARPPPEVLFVSSLCNPRVHVGVDALPAFTCLRQLY